MSRVLSTFRPPQHPQNLCWNASLKPSEPPESSKKIWTSMRTTFTYIYCIWKESKTLAPIAWKGARALPESQYVSAMSFHVFRYFSIFFFTLHMFECCMSFLWLSRPSRVSWCSMQTHPNGIDQLQTVWAKCPQVKQSRSLMINAKAKTRVKTSKASYTSCQA